MSFLMNNYTRADIAFVRGKGARVIDDKGREFIDFAAGIGVNSLGHANKAVVNAICEQSGKILHSSNLYRILPQERAAQKISELLKRHTYTFFCNSGAEANEAAIKLARKYGTENFKEKKYEILTLKNSFHGRTMATLKATGQDKFHPDIFAPYIDGFKFFDDIDEIISNINEKTVAVMIELIQGEGGIKPLEVDKVVKLAEVLKGKNLLLITDEVQCGVYRTGAFATSQIYGITPDIITFAKGLAGGVAIGACVCDKDIFAPGDHGSTFGGNFLATNTSLAVLNELENLQKSGKLARRISRFEKKLNKLVELYPEIFEKRVGLGLMQGLVLKDANNLSKIYTNALKHRVLILKSGNKTLRFLPPLNIKKSDIKEGISRLCKALDEI